MCRGMLQVFFDVHGAVAEGGQGLVLRETEELRELLRLFDDPHPLPAAARGRLDDHRKSDALRELERLLGVVDRARGARHRRDARVLRQPAGRGLVAHLPDLIAGGSDERDVRRHADLGELRVLGEEAVAGMDGVGAGDLGGGDDARDVEVGFARGGGADADVVVGEAHVQRFAIGFAVDRHRGDPKLPARANHPQGNLPAVGDQHLLEHYGVRSSAPEDTDCPVISLNVRSEAESTPETRSANSLGLVE